MFVFLCGCGFGIFVYRFDLIVWIFVLYCSLCLLLLNLINLILYRYLLLEW